MIVGGSVFFSPKNQRLILFYMGSLYLYHLMNPIPFDSIRRWVEAGAGPERDGENWLVSQGKVSGSLSKRERATSFAGARGVGAGQHYSCTRHCIA